MDHRQFVASLSAEQRVALTERSDAEGLKALALHWGAIAALSALIVARVPGWPLLMLPQGVLLVFLFTLLHETVHDTPFKSRWLNRFVGAACGIALLLPPLWFRFFHFAHHRHTQDPEKDPELATPKPETHAQYAWHVSGLPYLRDAVGNLFRHAFFGVRAGYLPAAKQRAAQREAAAMLLFYAGIAALSVGLGSVDALTLWVVPMLLGQPFLRLYLLAEHGRCAFVSNMFENTRTTFGGWLIRKLAWNMPFHAEHHAFPTAPFHKLPALHRLAKPHLVETEPSYAAFHGKYLRAIADDGVAQGPA